MTADGGLPRWLFVVLGVFVGLIVLFVGAIVACNAALDWARECNASYLTPGELKALLPPQPDSFRRTHQSQEDCRDGLVPTPSVLRTTYETAMTASEAVEFYREVAFKAGWLQRELYPAGIGPGEEPGSMRWSARAHQDEGGASMTVYAAPAGAGGNKTVVYVEISGSESSKTR